MSRVYMQAYVTSDEGQASSIMRASTQIVLTSVRMMSAAPLAAEVAPATAMPTSAFLSAGASLTPSPATLHAPALCQSQACERGCAQTHLPLTARLASVSFPGRYNYLKRLLQDGPGVTCHANEAASSLQRLHNAVLVLRVHACKAVHNVHLLQGTQHQDKIQLGLHASYPMCVTGFACPVSQLALSAQHCSSCVPLFKRRLG